MTNRFWSALATGLGACVALPLAAANLLVNPGFDSNSTGWTFQTAGAGAGAGWVAGIGRGGTDGISLFANFTGDSSFVRQCVNTSASVLDAHIYGKLHATSNFRYYGEASVSAFTQANCGGGYAGNAVSTPHLLDDGWVLYRIDGMQTPAATQSVMFIAGATGDHGTVTLHWDDAALGPAGTTGVPPRPANLLLNPDFA